jgi:hypothetical protein
MDALRAFRRDYDQEIKDRWPDGITPIETPFLQLMKEKAMAKKPAKPMKPMSKPSKGGKKGC